MDFITHLPVTADGHDSIFNIIDRFSKFRMVIPIRGDFFALDCANVFFSRWVC